MNILSIDVGMKNLAFCLFHINNNLSYTIDCWNVIDLCNETKYMCCCNKKNNTPCGKSAKYCKEGKYYCKIHAKNKTYKIPTTELLPYKIKKLNFKPLKSLANKFDIDFPKKIKKSELQTIISEHLKKFYFDVVQKTKTRDINLVQYGRNLKNKFNDILKDKTIDGVVVENQIGPLALRMKTLQGMIMQHFIEKDIPLVEEVSASNKLKEFINTKTTYNERKKASIKFTLDILSQNNDINQWLSFFNSHKKKDDLADCFLQGRWYLNKNLLKKK
tara:strand:- start:1723 stop:2544 length:822 start_codon:yes stop_codon:yes gene_type:complete